MDPTIDSDEKIAPQRPTQRYLSYLAILILVLQALISVVSYPFMPPMVPSHWNAAGQVDGYTPRLLNAILVPGMSIGLYLLIRILATVGPRLGNQSQRANQKVIHLILIGVLLFMLILQLAIIANVLGLPVDITLVVSLSLSLLFIFLGNYMGKLRRNFWGGIRTPWTLTNETVWERTHRLAGWLFVVGGVLGIVVSFIPMARVYGIIVIALGASCIPVIYSFVVYQRVVVHGNQSLSPPFDNNEEA